MRSYRPTHYTLTITPDLEELTFTGVVTIAFSTEHPVPLVQLDAVDLAIDSVTLSCRESDSQPPWTVGDSTLGVELPADAGGTFSLTIGYSGEINDLMAGFYRSRYRVGGEERYVGVTQFEERDARRAFPCIDEPGQKARFRISIHAPAGTTAISNEAAEQTETLENGRVLYRFAETPPISTYLVFFAVGPFDLSEDVSWRIPIRVAVSPGHGKYTGPALDYARQSITYLEELTGVWYPLSKLDSIGVTDFAFGAMENFGAISYRENFLLDIPEITTRKEREKQMGIAAHEIAHMWFGDLVSPAAWRYVWLNEAFATYLGNVVTDHWYPHWQTMDQFVLTSQAAAMDRDSHPNTIPIELDRDEIEIDASTAPIIYQKGANLLRMLRAFYGDQRFNTACTVYLKEYQFSSATTEDFLKTFGSALGEAAGEMLSCWITQPGVPVLQVHREGRTIKIRQDRFLLSGDRTQAPCWVIPVSGYTSSGEQIRVTLTERETQLTLASDARWVKLNTDQTGYYRVFYADPEHWDVLADAAAARDLSDLDRYGLVSDLFAFVNAGLVTADQFLAFVARFAAGEQSYVVLEALTEALLRIHELSGGASSAASVGRRALSPLADQLLATPTEEEPYQNVLLRESVLWALTRFGDESVAAALVAMAKDVAAGHPLHPDLVPVAMRVWASREHAALEWMTDRIRDPQTPEGRAVSLIAALSGVTEPEAVDEALTFILEEVPSRNRLYFLRKAASHTPISSKLWDWLTTGFEQMRGIHPYHLGSTLLLCGAFGGIGRGEEVHRFISAYEKGTCRVDRGVLDLTRDRLYAQQVLVGRLAE